MPAKANIQNTMQHVVVVGVGKSGQATARFLLSHGRELGIESLALVDSASSDSLDSFLVQLSQENGGAISIHATFGTDCVLEHASGARYDVCVMTPGLAPHTKLSQSAYQLSDEVISEIELAYRLSPQGLDWIAVTGTNGKTTTTELVRALLDSDSTADSTDGSSVDSTLGRQVFSVGNIGTPALDLLDVVNDGDIFVAEVSSFQAARLAVFKPRVAALLNLSSDHLDWHKDIATYAADKCIIFANSASGDVVFAPDESQFHIAARPVIANALEAARQRGAEVRIIQTDEAALPVRASEMQIRGQHNVINACFATAIAQYFGVSVADCARALKSFSAQPHRMQEIGRFNDVLYVNDSKATNPDASIQALGAYSGLRLTVLLGGQAKSGDVSICDDAEYLDLAKTALARAQSILLFGEVASELKAIFDDLCAAEDVADADIHCFASMEQAVRYAVDTTTPQQVVLLSPANASFDEFSNYIERGTAFKDIVKDAVCAGDVH